MVIRCVSNLMSPKGRNQTLNPFQFGGDFLFLLYTILVYKRILSSPLFYPAIIFFIWLILILTNYLPNTFLTGWDTLHPEFNFPKNFSDTFFGVWRSNQGLGAVAGHSHMADLPRIFILWIFHFIFPLSFLRYSYVFLCLLIGTLGFYYLTKFLFTKKYLAFLGSLFYLFNLGTLQQFYVPFEMFPTQWAFLPWIIYSSLLYLKHPTKSRLLLFGLITLFATPQAYAAHLWYPFFGLYLLFLLLQKNKKIIFLILTTLIVNSFWLFPNLYYLFTQSSNPSLSLPNRLHSQEFLMKNRQTGSLADTFLIKGFYFNWDQYDFTKKTTQSLMPEWNQHLENVDIKLIGNLLFFLSFVGLIITLFIRHHQLIPFTPFFIIPFILLANRTPLFNVIFDLLLKIPLFQDIFRFIFTKLSIVFTFGYAIFITFFASFLITTFPKIKKYFYFVPLILIIYCYPYFTGKLIASLVKIPIPNNYFQLNQYLSNQQPGIIITLPLAEKSGWTYTDWQYQGSGLIWFGSNQNFLDRDSDRWISTNEQAFREFHYSLYSKNYSQFKNSLSKFKVNKIIWDKSVITTFSKNQSQILFNQETQDILNLLIDQNLIKLEKTFGNLEIYSLNNQPSIVELKTINNYLGPSYRWSYFDYQNSADYLTTNTSQDTIFPYRSLLNDYQKIDQSTFDTLTKQLIYSNSKNQTLSSLNSINGLSFEFSNQSHQQSYLIAIKSKYQTGIPLRLCYKNLTTSLCAVEDEISKNNQSHWDYFLIPPQDDFFGYQLELNSISYGYQPSSSTLESIAIYKYSPNTEYTPKQNFDHPINYQVIFPNNSLIKAKVNSVPNSTLILNQSYSSGWLAISNGKILPHVLVNNWANGWELNSINNQTIYIIFWPQLLEFIGFILLLSLLFFFLIPQTRTRANP